MAAGAMAGRVASRGGFPADLFGIEVGAEREAPRAPAQPRRGPAAGQFPGDRMTVRRGYCTSLPPLTEVPLARRDHGTEPIVFRNRSPVFCHAPVKGSTMRRARLALFVTMTVLSNAPHAAWAGVRYHV